MKPSRRLPLLLFFTSSLGPIAGACDKTNPDDFHPPVRADAGPDTGIDGGEVGPDEVTFPEGFRWGSSTSAFQTETGNAQTDWGKWVTMQGKIKDAATPDKGGPDALNHIDDDIRALKDSGQNAYRFSMEWARLYPTLADLNAGRANAAAVTKYTELLDKLRAANIHPLVTLQHFSLPSYVSDPTKPAEPQGWERPETKDLFAKYCGLVAGLFKNKVDEWITINEPVVVALNGYVAGAAPPGGLLETTRAFAVARAEARAHALAYEAIHREDNADADGDGKPALVSIAQNMETFHPKVDGDAADIQGAKHIEYIWNWWFVNAIVKGDWDDDFDEKYEGPNDKRADPSLLNHVDWLGINYYTDILVSTHDGIQIPGVGASIVPQPLPTNRHKTDFAWDIHPEGLRAVLVQANTYGLPITVTENGIADASDANRARFITEHLYQAGWAIQNGVQLRGYYYWSLMDNFEWDSGYCPKFGLYSIGDGGARTQRGSVAAYRSIIEAKKVRRDATASLRAYQPPTICN
ncbi:glycoside hydrolase family 1 protein [Pendulispora brunnea]|uniref:Glycoside hydrolase family 1 protein n=1 Tax=Pendulispora brunnea TaxID=2905690 RepID=A0ABZ2KHX4_9BACT